MEPGSDGLLVGATVLVVDDDPLDRQLLCAVIGQRHRVLQASSAPSARQVLDGGDVDLVVLDAVMPGLGGVELTRLLGSHRRHRDLPVVLVSGYAAKRWESTALAAGAVDVLAKPVNPEVLLARVDAHLRRARRLRQERRLAAESDAELLVVGATVASWDRLVAQLPVGVWEQDPDGRLLRVNEAAAELVGRPAHELVGLEVGELVGPEVSMAVLGPVPEGSPGVACWVRDARGHQLRATLLLRDLPADDELPATRIVVMLTQPERAGGGVASLVPGWRHVSAPGGVGTLTYDLGSRRWSWSRAAGLLLGIAAPIADGVDGLLPAVHADDRALFSHRWSHGIEHGRVEVEFRTGAPLAARWLRLVAEQRRGGDGGARRMEALVVDITPERERIELLGELVEQGRAALATTRVMAWTWDPATDRVSFPGTRVLPVDVSVGPDGVARDDLLALIHPDDRTRLDELMLADELVSSGSSPVLDLRLRTVDGSWRSFRVQVEGQISLGGGPCVAGVVWDVTDEHPGGDALEIAYRTDRLTGLANQTSFLDHLRALLESAARGEAAVAVACIDVDHFGDHRSALGEQRSQDLLRLIAGRLRGLASSPASVARLGADVFAVAVSTAGPEDRLDGPLQHLDTLLEPPLSVDGSPFPVSFSTGVARVSAGETIGPVRLLQAAQAARDQAKLRGGGQRWDHDREADRRRNRRFERSRRVRAALVAGQLRLHYQPKVSLVDGRLHGVEALLRWQHPERGLLLPGEFIEALEDPALAQEVGAWVLGTGLEQLARWEDQGLSTTLSVNVSTGELEADGLLDRVRDELAGRPQLVPGQLQLEVLETSLIDDLEGAAATVAQLRDAGVSVALDDFGVGASSVKLLHRLAVDQLKIDRSFVRDLPEDRIARTAVRGMIRMAADLGLSVVAEGVESDRHVRVLRGLGCELGQGFGIARPMPGSELPGWAAAWQRPASWDEPEVVDLSVPPGSVAVRRR